MLQTATELVLETGVRGFTVDEVARRSGVAKTTIYRHFPSSAELMITAMDSMIAPFPTPDNGSLRADLIEFIGTVLPIFSEPALRPVMLDILAESARNPEVAALHRAMMENRLGSMRAIYEQARSRGEIAADLDFDSAFTHIEGPFVARWMMRPETMGDVDIEATVGRIVGLLGAETPIPTGT